MKHLEDTNTTYLQHLLLALYNSVRLLCASLTLFIHSLFPYLFTKTTSNILNNVIDSFPEPVTKKHRILVRFNTKHKDDIYDRCWRILVDNKEILVHKVYIKTSAESVTLPINDEIKFHFLLYGNLEHHISDSTHSVTIY